MRQWPWSCIVHGVSMCICFGPKVFLIEILTCSQLDFIKKHSIKSTIKINKWSILKYIFKWSLQTLDTVMCAM